MHGFLLGKELCFGVVLVLLGAFKQQLRILKLHDEFRVKHVRCDFTIN